LSFDPRKCEVDGQEVAFTMENQEKNEIKVMVPIHFGKLVIS
jgi:alpha-glucosidase